MKYSAWFLGLVVIYLLSLSQHIHAAKVKIVIADVEHVLATSVQVSDSSEHASYTFTLKDQAAIRKAKEKGIKVILFSENNSPALAKWANQQGVSEIYQGVYNSKACFGDIDTKKKLIQKVATKYFVRFSEIAYISDDPTAVEARKIVGFTGCSPSAEESVKKTCAYITSDQTGSTAFSDYIDMLATA
jgi:3-deoxy-D-manno-octulosonate 8-phosphate phosphatase (KDO 8-P phosphatase)